MMNKAKLLNVGLILTSLIAYLEWGENHQRFLFQMEWEVIVKFMDDPIGSLHPFTILPLIGQVILLTTLFQKKPNRAQSLIGMMLLGSLIYFVLFIGIISLNFKIFILSLPHVVLTWLTIKHHRKRP